MWQINQYDNNCWLQPYTLQLQYDLNAACKQEILLTMSIPITEACRVLLSITFLELALCMLTGTLNEVIKMLYCETA